jgi:lipopolysaccharide transport system ATP-binding protein
METATNNQKISNPLQNNDVVLSVEGISKKFCRSLKRSLFYGIRDITAELVGMRQPTNQLRREEFWALKDVNLELRRGEALGLIGVNGSGKTTLLRIISGLIKPDTGRVMVRGQVAPLIALGAGFSPILTGRENIYANMSILGLSTQEINERFEAVVAFAEIGEAIDAPVQSYSSGMAARLGFSCAIHTDPEILLIDEVLAVGDIQFLAKCHRRLHELREKGTAFVLVSHNPQAILSMCQQSIYLQKGHVIAFGDTETVMNQYEEDLFLGTAEKAAGILKMPEKSLDESQGLDITSLCFKDVGDRVLEDLVSGETVQLCIGFTAHKALNNVNLRISIMKEGQTILYFGGSNDKLIFQINPGSHEIQIYLPEFGLAPGVYIMRVDIRSDALYILDLIETFRFVVRTNGRMSKSAFYQQRSWKLVSQKEEFAAKEDAGVSP